MEEEMPYLQPDGGALSPKVGEVAADLIWAPPKSELEEAVGASGLSCPSGALMSRRSVEPDDETVKTGKAISNCSTGIEDSVRNSKKSSGLRVPSSDCSEYTEITAARSDATAAGRSDKMHSTPMGIILGSGVSDGEPQHGPVVAAVRSLTRSGEKARKLTRQIVQRVEERVHNRRRSTHRSGFWRTPSQRAATDLPPLLTMHVKGLTVAGIHAVLERSDDCPLVQFLEEVFDCTDMNTTDWVYSCDSGSDQVRQSSYKMPVPRDIPEVAARLLRVPETISGTTAWRLHSDSRELWLVQHSWTKDVLFGDRFKLRNTISFVEEPSGGVTVNSWTDVVWVTPLPWTHGVIKHVIEKKAKSDSAGLVTQLVGMVQDAVSA